MSLVLVYHRIGPPGREPDSWRLAVSAANFEQHLELLASSRHVLPLGALVERLGTASLPRDAVAITFDDGYAESLAFAVPRLRSAGLPATIFLATGLLGRPEFWWDRAALLVSPEESADGHRELERLWLELRSATPAEREQRLADLESRRSARPVGPRAGPCDRPQTVAEARALASDAITLGSHTVTHPWLPDLPAARVEEEVAAAHARSRDWNLGRETYFAYPYGAHDESVRSIVSAQSIRAAFTTEARSLEDGAERMAVPRLAVEDWPAEELAAALDRFERAERARPLVLSPGLEAATGSARRATSADRGAKRAPVDAPDGAAPAAGGRAAGPGAAAPPRVVALIAAYNEADVLPAVIGDLVDQGVGVYLIDNRSTDATADVARAFADRGLIGVETFPPAGEADEGFAWRRILERKEQLALELDADWFIHHDADEFRESPWPGVGLGEAIGIVDRLGYNAIDFAVFNFWPSDESFRAGDDPREKLARYLPGDEWDRVQIKCWKRQGEKRVDLAADGGHDARFPGREVFPIRFVLRHYPIRSRAHARRKILEERLPRFRAEEREIGWHVQYDRRREELVPAPEELLAWDAEAAAVGLQIENRRLEAARDELAAHQRREEQSSAIAAALGAELESTRAEVESTRAERDAARAETRAVAAALEAAEARRGSVEREAEELRSRSQALIEVVDVRERQLAEAGERALGLEASIAELRREVGRARAELEALRGAHEELAGRLRDVLTSRSWRLTAPLRRAVELLRGPRRR